jgi:hypothetical protein
LTRAGRGPKKLANVDDMIGFYILLASEPNGEIRGDLRRAITYESTFVTTCHVTADKELKVIRWNAHCISHVVRIALSSIGMVPPTCG